MHFLLIILALVSTAFTAEYHRSAASAGVNFVGDNGNGIENTLNNVEEKPRNRRIYALCPPKFQRIGTECYYMPEEQRIWLEAHFFCKDKNSKLAEPTKYSDRKLNMFLQQHDRQSNAYGGYPDPIWLGSTYDWLTGVWQWSISGKNLTYDAFSQMDPE
ncbi:collectin-12-like [Teleopsis dalmanni]|nr:collectin-12-like [Teleopsis dalmanni]